MDLDEVTSGWAGTRTRGAAIQQAPAGAAPATRGVLVQEHGHGALAARGAAKTPALITNNQLLVDCWKETPRGVLSRAEFEAFIEQIGGRLVWLNLDGGGLNFELYLPAGKGGKREIRVQGQYLHGQNQFSEGRLAEGFALPTVFYVDGDGKFAAKYASGKCSPVLLRVSQAAPGAAFSVRALLHDLGTLAVLDSKSCDGKWVVCTPDGLVHFGGGSMGWTYLDRHDKVQKSLVVDPSNAAATPFFDPYDKAAPAAFLRMVETALVIAAGQAAHGARKDSQFATKLFLRRRDSELGPFASFKKKAAAEAVAVEAVEKMQSELVAASSRKALAVAAPVDPHLRSLTVEPLAFVAPAAASREEAITGVGLLLQVRDACTKPCLQFRGVCTCELKWNRRGKLVNMTTAGEGVRFYFDDHKKDVTIPTVSQIKERVKPASGNGDGLSLVRKAARAAVLAGWNAPAGLLVDDSDDEGSSSDDSGGVDMDTTSDERASDVARGGCAIS